MLGQGRETKNNTIVSNPRAAQTGEHPKDGLSIVEGSFQCCSLC